MSPEAPVYQYIEFVTINGRRRRRTRGFHAYAKGATRLDQPTAYVPVTKRRGVAKAMAQAFKVANASG